MYQVLSLQRYDPAVSVELFTMLYFSDEEALGFPIFVKGRSLSCDMLGCRTTFTRQDEKTWNLII